MSKEATLCHLAKTSIMEITKYYVNDSNIITQVYITFETIIHTPNYKILLLAVIKILTQHLRSGLPSPTGKNVLGP